MTQHKHARKHAHHKHGTTSTPTRHRTAPLAPRFAALSCASRITPACPLTAPIDWPAAPSCLLLLKPRRRPPDPPYRSRAPGSLPARRPRPSPGRARPHPLSRARERACARAWQRGTFGGARRRSKRRPTPAEATSSPTQSAARAPPGDQGKFSGGVRVETQRNLACEYFSRTAWRLLVSALRKTACISATHGARSSAE